MSSEFERLNSNNRNNLKNQNTIDTSCTRRIVCLNKKGFSHTRYTPSASLDDQSAEIYIDSTINDEFYPF